VQVEGIFVESASVPSTRFRPHWQRSALSDSYAANELAAAIARRAQAGLMVSGYSDWMISPPLPSAIGRCPNFARPDYNSGL